MNIIVYLDSICEAHNLLSLYEYLSQLLFCMSP